MVIGRLLADDRGARLGGRVQGQRLDGVVLVVLTLLVFVGFLGRANIVTSHEARVALTAQRMAESGWPWAAKPAIARMPPLEVRGGQVLPTLTSEGKTLEVNPWLVPVFEGQVRLQKPPLPYWCSAVLLMLIGDLEWASRLVPALLGSLSALLMYSLGRRLFDRRVGQLAAGVWISTVFVVSQCRMAMADSYLASFTLLAVWAWVALAQDADGATRRRYVGLLAAFYGSLALGLLAKGPVMLAHVAIAAAAYGATCRPRWPRIRWWHHLIGVAAVLALTLPWPLYLLERVPDAMAIWRYESIGEFGENTRNARPWHYYLPMLFYLPLPWTPLWVYGMAHAITRRRRRLWFAVIWSTATVVFFSFVNLKKNAYLLPMMPAQTLVIAQAAAAMLVMLRKSLGKQQAIQGLSLVQRSVAGVWAMVVAGMIISEGIINAGRYNLHLTGLSISLRILAAVVSIGLCWLMVKKPNVWDLRGLNKQAACCAVLAAIFLAFPTIDRQNRRVPKEASSKQLQVLER